MLERELAPAGGTFLKLLMPFFRKLGVLQYRFKVEVIRFK
jgi:hypothetical protein